MNICYVRGFMVGVFVAIVVMELSNDYVLVSRRKYKKLKRRGLGI